MANIENDNPKYLGLKLNYVKNFFKLQTASTSKSKTSELICSNLEIFEQSTFIWHCQKLLKVVA